jgi:hypothetical protein
MVDRTAWVALVVLVLAGSLGAQEAAGREAKARKKSTPVGGGKFTIQEMHPLRTESLLSSLHVFRHHDDPPQWKIDLLTRAHEVLGEDKRATYEELVSDAAFRKIVEARKMKLLGGPMLGQVSEAGAAVWVRTFGPAEVRVQLDDGGKSRRFGPVTSFSESGFAVVVPVRRLPPDAGYPYVVLLNGEARES